MLSVSLDGRSDHFTITIPVRKGAVFSGSPLTSQAVDGVIFRIHGDDDLAGSDLAVTENVIADDAGMPALSDYDASAGSDYVYRSFRLAATVSDNGKGFFGVRFSRD